MLLQKFAVVGDLRQAAGFDVIQRIGQRHVAERMVMAVGFAVGGDVGQLRPVALIRQCVQQTLREALAVVQQALKGHRPRDRPVVEEQVDGAARTAVSAGRRAPGRSAGRVTSMPSMDLACEGARIVN